MAPPERGFIISSVRPSVSPIQRADIGYPIRSDLFNKLHDIPRFAPHPPYTTDDVTRLKHTLIRLAARGNYEPETSLETPPSYLIHQLQVATLVEELCPSDPTAAMVAALHDLGRHEKFNMVHVPIGYDIARELGFSEEMACIAILHHGWGYAINPIAEQTDRLFIHSDADHTQIDAWKQLLGTDNESVFLGGLATLVADQSKIKHNGHDKPAEIAPLTKELADYLIDVQVKKGSYAHGSPTWHREMRGKEFVLSLIPYLEEKTGVRYTDAIERAQKRFKAEVEPRLKVVWRAEYTKQQKLMQG